MPRSFLPAVVVLLGLIGPPLMAADYDLVIRNGRIVDGTGNPWFRGDVAIRGDRVVSVGRVTGTAEREIDASGLIVAPGFIDIHSHSDFLLLEDGQAQSKIRQGVTTEILGEGNSAGPYRGKLSPRPRTVRGKEREWATLGGYFDVVDDAGVSVNVASYVGLNNVWRSVMGESFARPTEEQIAGMGKLVDEAMREGALGLSSQVMMPPGSLATTDDIVALCRVVARHGGIYSTHIRNEGTGVFESVKEAIDIGRRASVPVDVIHLKIADQKFWGRMDEVVELIAAARREGINVQANVYPYTRGNNNLVSIIPPWAHEGGRQKLLERLRDPAMRKRMKHDIEHGVEGWYNHYTAVGGDWSRMLVSGNTTFRGLTMDRVMAARTTGRPNADLLDELFEILLEEDGSVGTVFAHHTEDDMTLALQQPWCSVGSDGSAYAIAGPLRRGNPHPRNFGTFPRVLGVYVRELGLLRLEDAVRKMTSLNAAKVGLTDRGLLRPGQYADITVFDPKTVIDRSAYSEPFQYSTGIRHVLVNGQPVLENGEHTGALPGRALRRTGRSN
ncbi:MAG: amidohydrolase family protein [Planctomycetaceae bacterium]|nr:amidohydrolase family protein [Planctomycetaceae bacterium]